jgi:hypothetical protein
MSQKLIVLCLLFMPNCCAAIEGHHSHFMQYPHAEKIALFSECHHKTTSSYFFGVKTQDKLSMELEVLVLEGSRLNSEGQFKHSYHVIGTNLAFDSNVKKGSLEAFVLDFQKTHAKDKLFFWPGEPHCSIIDTSVYSRNRVLRTPLSFKLNDESKTPLKLLQPWDCHNRIEEAFITNLAVPASDLRILSMEDISSVIPVEPARSFHPLTGGRKTDGASAARHGGGGSRNARVQAAGLVLPADVVQQLQALLDAAESKGCQVLDKPPVPSKKDGTPNFACENVERRECLVCKGEEHKDNHAGLNVRPDGQVHYWCHAPRCKSQGPQYIGDLKPDLEATTTSASASGKTTTDMELDEEVEPLPSISDDKFPDSASQPSSFSCGSSTEPAFCSLHGAVIRELALMGPAADIDDAWQILRYSAEAAAVREQSEGGAEEALQAAAFEWVCRTKGFLLEATTEEVTTLQDEVAALFVLHASVGRCSAADVLAKLRSARYSKKDWIKFCASTSPVSNGYTSTMTAEHFIQAVNPEHTDALSMVLAARLLWPQERDKFYEFVAFDFKRSEVQGLDKNETFDGVWSMGADEAAGDFKECILMELLIMQHAFLRDVLPGKMCGMHVAHYRLSQDVLSFWMDPVDHLDRGVEYRFNFCTGIITSSRGEGIIHRMYSMKRFFEKERDAAILADLLVENGIKDKLRYDTDHKQWRIFDANSGIWTCPPTSQSYVPEIAVSAFVREHLEPVREAENLFGKPLDWDKKIMLETLTSDGSTPSKSSKTDQAAGPAGFKKKGLSSTNELDPSDSASQVTVGSKRSRSILSTASTGFKAHGRSKISEFLKKYTANTFKHPSETVRALKDKVPFSFSEMQKPHLLCCPNGLVDLRTGKLLGKPKPDDFITQVCITEYDPDADLSPAAAFFEQYFPLGAYQDQQEIVRFLRLWPFNGDQPAVLPGHVWGRLKWKE